MTGGTIRVVAVSICLFATPCAAAGGAQEGPRAFDDLRASVAQTQSTGALEIRLRWRTAAPTANAALTENRFELLSAQSVAGAMRPDRAPQVTSNTLVVISLDSTGRELDWRTMADPRVVRAELSDQGLSGTRLYYVDIDFLMYVPALPETTAIRICSVRAVNRRAVLDVLGTVTVR